MRFQEVDNIDDLISLVENIGFLPFFTNRIPGFSLEEIISPECWYQGLEGGRIDWPAWDWKGEVVQRRSLIYGKLYERKAGFVSPEWMPHLCNYRRGGYDFDARYEDGMAQRKDKLLMEYLQMSGPTLSRDMKRDLDYRKGGSTGFDTVVTRLQMQTYIVPVNYEYARSKDGEEYGFGVARYGTTEEYWGDDICTSEYGAEPEESFERIVQHLTSVLPDIDEAEIRRLMK